MKFYHLAITALAVTMASVAMPPVAPAMAAATIPSAAPKSWTVGNLVISDAYARATLPGAPVGGGFISITNKGPLDDTLVSVTSPGAGLVQLHSMSMADGIMKMRELPDGLPVPAGKTVTFSPDGLHLMFMHLKGPFVKGRSVPATLSFAKAGRITVELAVGSIAASGPPEGTANPSSPVMSGMQM